MDNRIELQNISESQRALLKCRLKQLFECKYQSVDFCNKKESSIADAAVLISELLK